MLRAYALADLFEANLDDTAEGIFLTTTGGNLIGLSPHMPPALSKRLSVLGALTWRYHAGSMPGFNSINAQSVGTSAASSYLTMAHPEAAAGGGAHGIVAPSTDPSHGRAYPLAVLKKVAGSPGELRELAIECDGRVCALEYVREGLLIGAISGVVAQDKARGSTLNGEASIEGGGEDAEPGRSNGNGNGSASFSRRGSGETDEPAATAATERERAKRNDHLVRLLGLKANAMADYLRDEIKNFRMPSGLE